MFYFPDTIDDRYLFGGLRCAREPESKSGKQGRPEVRNSPLITYDGTLDEEK